MPVYVAKPEVAVPSQVLPAGWNPGWQWPGANPPGYVVPEAGVKMYSEGVVSPGDSVSAHALWMAASFDGPIGLPDGWWTQRWSAAIEGYAVGIRNLGGAFSGSLEFPYSVVGNYFGAESDIEFDITDENGGDTIVLSVETTVDGETYSDSVDIVVEVENTNYLKMQFSRVSVFGAQGVLVVSCPGGSATFESASNSVTSATGVFTVTGAREVTIEAEGLTEISGSTIAGQYSASSTSSLQTNPRSTVSVQLYNEAGVQVTGESASKQFSLVLPAYGSDATSEDVCTVTEDEITQL